MKTKVRFFTRDWPKVYLTIPPLRRSLWSSKVYQFHWFLALAEGWSPLSGRWGRAPRFASPVQTDPTVWGVTRFRDPKQKRA